MRGRALEGNLMGESAEPEVSIYLPPSYAADRSRRYPVVYLLHGYTGTDLSCFGPTGRQLHVIAERVLASGAAKEMILVMPNCMNAYGGCMYSNSAIAMDVGLQDNLITSNRVFEEALTRFGLAHTFETYEGDHSNRIPQRIEEKVLPFFSQQLSFEVPRAPHAH